MPAPSRAVTYVFVESRWIPYTNEETGTLGTAVPIPAPVEFTITPTGTQLNQPHSGTRGDVITTQKGFDLSLTNAGFTAAVEAAIFGNTIATSGTDPNEIVSIDDDADDNGPLGEWEGRVLNANGGDVVVRLYGVRFQNAAAFGGSQGALGTTVLPGTVSGHPTTKRLRRRQTRQTAVALSGS